MVRQRRKHEENLFNLSLRSKVSKFSFIKGRSHEGPCDPRVHRSLNSQPQDLALSSLEQGITLFLFVVFVWESLSNLSIFLA